MAKEKLKFKRQQFTELTNFHGVAQRWEYIKELVDHGRKRKHCLQSIVNAILKVTRTGCQCGSPPGRNLDEKYPPWQSVYYYFTKWQKDGAWAQILALLVEKERVRQGREA